MAAQRDLQVEREEKTAIFQDIMQVWPGQKGRHLVQQASSLRMLRLSVAQRSAALDEEWGLREVQVADAEEAQRRRNYANARQRRTDLEVAEMRFGFLANQVRSS